MAVELRYGSSCFFQACCGLLSTALQPNPMIAELESATVLSSPPKVAEQNITPGDDKVDPLKLLQRLWVGCLVLPTTCRTSSGLYGHCTCTCVHVCQVLTVHLADWFSLWNQWALVAAAVAAAADSQVVSYHPFSHLILPVVLACCRENPIHFVPETNSSQNALRPAFHDTSAVVCGQRGCSRKLLSSWEQQRTGWPL